MGGEPTDLLVFGCHLAPLTGGHPAALHLWSQNLLLRWFFIHECLCLWGQIENETDPHLCRGSNVTSVSKASCLHTSWLHLLEVRLLPRINGHKIPPGIWFHSVGKLTCTYTSLTPTCTAYFFFFVGLTSFLRHSLIPRQTVT